MTTAQPDEMNPTTAALHDDIDRIEASGVLGRSPVYGRLLRYLASATMEDRTVSEIEIATELFNKGGDFDSNQDSMVRVYMHNLRQRIKRYYENNDDKIPHLIIPRGEYRLVYESDHPLADPMPSRGRYVNKFATYAVGILIAVNLAVLGYLTTQVASPSELDQVSQNPIWAPVLDSELPLLVVVGDYYIFAELDINGNIVRMVREFDINSKDDLSTLMEFDPTRPFDYMDLDLTYLPQSTAFALKDVLSVIYSRGKRVSVLPSSQLRVSDLRNNNIVYVGYLSGLGLLEQYVFAESDLRLGDTYDELIHRESNTYFFSNAGIPERSIRRDFGFVSSFSGPTGENRIAIVAGTRDSGLMQMAQIVSSVPGVEPLATTIRGTDEFPEAFEALYQVAGSDRMSLNATLVHHAALDVSRLWGRPQEQPGFR